MAANEIELLQVRESGGKAEAAHSASCRNIASSKQMLKEVVAALFVDIVAT